jgi:hypothetical protein
MNVIQSLEAMLSRFISYIPNVVGALVILAVGYLIAAGLGRLTTRLLARAHVDERLARHDMLRPGSHAISNGTGTVIFWALFLVALGAAADTLQVAVVSNVIGRLVGYVPRFVVAAVMVAVGVALGSWVKAMVVRSSTSSSARLGGTAVKIGIIVLTSFMAARELEIGASILNMAFLAVIGAASVAFAIAFGLGGREIAGRVARDWYERTGRTKDALGSGAANVTTTTSTPLGYRPSAPSVPH